MARAGQRLQAVRLWRCLRLLEAGHSMSSLCCWANNPCPWRLRAQLAENFNGADLRNICTEAGMFAIRDERDYATQDDFMKVCGRAQLAWRRARGGWRGPAASGCAAFMLTPLLPCPLCGCYNQAVRKMVEAKKLESSAHTYEGFGEKKG